MGATEAVSPFSYSWRHRRALFESRSSMQRTELQENGCPCFFPPNVFLGRRSLFIERHARAPMTSRTACTFARVPYANADVGDICSAGHLTVWFTVSSSRSVVLRRGAFAADGAHIYPLRYGDTSRVHALLRIGVDLRCCLLRTALGQRTTTRMNVRVAAAPRPCRPPWHAPLEVRPCRVRESARRPWSISESLAINAIYVYIYVRVCVCVYVYRG